MRVSLHGVEAKDLTVALRQLSDHPQEYLWTDPVEEGHLLLTILHFICRRHFRQVIHGAHPRLVKALEGIERRVNHYALDPAIEGTISSVGEGVGMTAHLDHRLLEDVLSLVAVTGVAIGDRPQLAGIPTVQETECRLLIGP